MLLTYSGSVVCFETRQQVKQSKLKLVTKGQGRKVRSQRRAETSGKGSCKQIGCNENFFGSVCVQKDTGVGGECLRTSVVPRISTELDVWVSNGACVYEGGGGREGELRDRPSIDLRLVLRCPVQSDFSSLLELRVLECASRTSRRCLSAYLSACLSGYLFVSLHQPVEGRLEDG